MPIIDKTKISKTLKLLIDQLNTNIEQVKDSTKPVTLDQQSVGRVSRIDAIQQQQMQKAALERMEHQRKLAQFALKRLQTETFGYCSLCEEPIDEQRLYAKPESPFCFSCADQQ